MPFVFTLLLIAIFLILSGIHWYWAFGGQWGFKEVLPTNLAGERVLNPKIIDSVIVALGLLFFALVYSSILQPNFIPFPNWTVVYGKWVIPSIFLLRFFGDFKYLGLFKKIKSTPFAIRDTKYFIPLCGSIAFLGYLVALKP